MFNSVLCILGFSGVIDISFLFYFVWTSWTLPHGVFAYFRPLEALISLILVITALYSEAFNSAISEML